MATVRISGVQMRVGAKKDENLPRILNLIERSDADFLLFPQMSLTGYNNDFSDVKTETALDAIAEKCRISYTAALVGTGTRMEGKSYQQTRIISDEGELIGTYEQLTPIKSDRSWCSPGDELRTFEHGGVKFGCLIGNDLWVTPGQGPYPDRRLSYRLSKEGVDVIFLSLNTGPDPDYRVWHEENLRLRAREAGCFIVTANACSDDGEVNAPSGVISPDGEWVTLVPRTGEHTYFFDFDVD